MADRFDERAARWAPKVGREGVVRLARLLRETATEERAEGRREGVDAACLGIERVVKRLLGGELGPDGGVIGLIISKALKTVRDGPIPDCAPPRTEPQRALDMLIALAGVQQTEDRRAEQLKAIETLGDAFGLNIPWKERGDG